LAPGKDPLAVELALEKVTPAEFKMGAHHWLILHGRYICVARTPECWRCPVADLCAYQPKTPPPGSPQAVMQKKKNVKAVAKIARKAAKEAVGKIKPKRR
ncbi:MAG: endonuclease III, partial [Rhodospirillaceae bacterium]